MENKALLDGYLTTDEAAKELRVHWRTMKRWATYRKGPPQVRIGRRVYYRREDIAEWLAQQVQASICPKDWNRQARA